MNQARVHEDSKSLISLLSPKLGTRARRLAEAIVLGETLYKMAKATRARMLEKNTFRVCVNSIDALYADIHEWLVTQIPSEQRKSLYVRSPRDSRFEAIPDDDAPIKEKLALFYDGSLRQSVKIDGHEVAVWVESPVAVSTSHQSGYSTGRSKIFFETSSSVARDAIIKWLNALNDSRAPEIGPRLYLANRWGWERQDNARPRPLSSVALGAGIQESLVADLRKFLDDEDAYIRLGLPWHRGYLLYGPPGTGKTTIARALAAHFGLDVYYMPLSDLNADTDLLQLVGNVKQKAILIIEDVDVVHAAKSRDDAESIGISLSGLLNALDGVTTPHGLVTILTTNDRDVLDPALIRPGRSDMEIEIGYLTNEQAKRLLSALTGLEDVPTPLVDGKNITPAEMVGIIKQHLHDPEAAVSAVLDQCQLRQPNPIQGVPT